MVSAMGKTKFELAHIINHFGEQYVQRYNPNAYNLHILNAITECRTSALGGHENACDCCGNTYISYNSCRNRHCPKCQGSKQALWVDALIHATLPVKHYHVVFTVPHVLNDICLLDSASFYNLLFACAWDTLRTAGYANFGVETGAVCVLHTWGQNLCLHPHLHCIVPATGLSLSGNWKHIAKSGKYLFPVTKLSVDFRGHFLNGLKGWLVKENLLKKYQAVIDKAWKKPWVVHCEPSMAGPEHVIGYLGNYTLRVAITNSRIIDITDTHVTFLHKDYAKGAKIIPITLDGVEFLHRFCQHILPKKFVKIRRYGVYSSRYKAIASKLKPKTIDTLLRDKEAFLERLFRVTGFDITLCPVCKTGKLHRIAELPKIRSPTNFYALINNIC
jgi:hypothetical protein